MPFIALLRMPIGIRTWLTILLLYSTTFLYKTSSMKKETSRYIFLKIVQSHSRHANAWSQLTLYRY